MTTPRSFPPPQGPPVSVWPPPPPPPGDRRDIPTPPRQYPAPHRPARTAHGVGWWLAVGWWWAPCAWGGRVLLWLILWPVGLWRSVRHSRKQGERRARR